MKAMCGLVLQSMDKPMVLGFNQKWKKEYSLPVANFNSKSRKKCNLELSNCVKKSNACPMETGNFYASLDRNWFLKAKGKEVASSLNEQCIFLVGMMGSGKSTVGKVLSEALGYSFVDSDKYVEQVAGAASVTEIFNKWGETYFRDYESEALRALSLMPRQVVATGGGAVIRPINWIYMNQGITVYLDVPLDALARRIAAVGTDSRPLLHFDSGDPYTKAFMRLFTLLKKRSESYSNADVTVSLLALAESLGLEDLSDLTPAAIAVEVLVQIEKYISNKNSRSN
ncbi:shikimate kinase 3, chloroplastic-like [Mangifera indica]|uniref:shikimate kinase 3, chloroplastic-like n=1 Tax=Mangifera indica TaxID=29780 RepID=UPI001CFA7E35|nr:shikimate kinase 3, chloroplastic-like [Mangifera indica]XP_044512203.1 shikimate kinase 3, chloroplastic-like [Mangifera indica]